ncbi:MAG: YHS domain-containing (seleno)protein, partial [Pseudomonadota bacterium]
WHFASPANAEAFSENPNNFEPQFNGWCAYAVAEGYGAEVDFIEGWALLDGKLYFNWNKSTRNDFVARQSQLKKRAKKRWPKVHKGILSGAKKIYRHKNYPRTGIKHPQTVAP